MPFCFRASPFNFACSRLPSTRHGITIAYKHVRIFHSKIISANTYIRMGFSQNKELPKALAGKGFPPEARYSALQGSSPEFATTCRDTPQAATLPPQIVSHCAWCPILPCHCKQCVPDSEVISPVPAYKSKERSRPESDLSFCLDLIAHHI